MIAITTRACAFDHQISHAIYNTEALYKHGRHAL